MLRPCCVVQILSECQNADVLCDGFLLDKLVHLIIGLNWWDNLHPQ